MVTLVDLLSIKHLVEDDTGLDVHVVTRGTFPASLHGRFQRGLVRVL
jgi:hypothetical protein